MKKPFLKKKMFEKSEIYDVFHFLMKPNLF